MGRCVVKEMHASCSEKEIGNEETDKAETCYDLDRNAVCRDLLDAHTGCASCDPFLGVLVHSVCLSLAQDLF